MKLPGSSRRPCNLPNDVVTSRKRGSRCLLQIFHQCIGISPVAKPLNSDPSPMTAATITMIIATKRQRQRVATEIAKTRSAWYLIDFALFSDISVFKPLHVPSCVMSLCRKCHKSPSGILSSTNDASSISPTSSPPPDPFIALKVETSVLFGEPFFIDISD